MKTIPLTQGYMAMVDDQDYEWLSQYKWRVDIDDRVVYAVRHSAGRHASRKMIRMHQAVLGTALGMETDHINGDGLDNRRASLRECSRQENSRNSRSRLGSSSTYLGASWDRGKHKWRADIKVDGRTRYLGRFRTEAEAGSAYKTAAAITFGEFASGARGDRTT